MNIVKTIEQYNEDHVYFCEPIKNNVMNDGFFIRIIYSNSLFILNGINIHIQFNNVIFDKYYNKYKCSFNIMQHKELIDKLRNIEENLLRKININKQAQYKINDQIKNGNIKLFLENINHEKKDNINHEKKDNNCFLLKISGIWETETHYGLTYKFLKTCPLFPLQPSVVK